MSIISAIVAGIVAGLAGLSLSSDALHFADKGVTRRFIVGIYTNAILLMFIATSVGMSIKFGPLPGEGAGTGVAEIISTASLILLVLLMVMSSHVARTATHNMTRNEDEPHVTPKTWYAVTYRIVATLALALAATGLSL